MKQTSIEADVIITDFKFPPIGFYLPVPPNAIKGGANESNAFCLSLLLLVCTLQTYPTLEGSSCATPTKSLFFPVAFSQAVQLSLTSSSSTNFSNHPTI